MWLEGKPIEIQLNRRTIFCLNLCSILKTSISSNNILFSSAVHYRNSISEECAITEIRSDLENTRQSVDKLDRKVTSLSRDVASLSSDVKTILRLLTSFPPSPTASELGSPTSFTRERYHSYTPGVTPGPHTHSRHKVHRDSVSSAPGLSTGVVGILKTSGDRTPPNFNRVDFHFGQPQTEGVQSPGTGNHLQAALLQQFSEEERTSARPVGEREETLSDSAAAERASTMHRGFRAEGEAGEIDKLGQKISSSDSGMDSPKGWQPSAAPRPGPLSLASMPEINITQGASSRSPGRPTLLLQDMMDISPRRSTPPDAGSMGGDDRSPNQEPTGFLSTDL